MYFGLATEDRSVAVLAATKSNEPRIWSHSLDPTVFSVSSDGSVVAMGTRDGQAFLCMATSGKKIASWQARGEVRAIAVSSDGTRVATISDSFTVEVFAREGSSAKLTLNLAEAWGEPGKRLPVEVRLASVDPEVTQCLVWARPSSTRGDVRLGQLTLWSLETGEARFVDTVAWKGRRRAVRNSDHEMVTIGWCAKSHRFFVVTSQPSIQWFCVDDDMPSRACNADTDVLSLSVSPTGDRAAAGYSDGVVRLWSLVDGKLLRCWWLFEDDRVRTLLFLTNGEGMVVAGYSKVLALAATGELTDCPLESDVSYEVRGLAAHPEDGVLIAFSPGLVVHWGVQNKDIRKEWRFSTKKLSALAVSTTLDCFAVGCEDGTVILQPCADSSPPLRTWRTGAVIVALAFVTNDSELLIVDDFGIVQLVDVRTGWECAAAHLISGRVGGVGAHGKKNRPVRVAARRGASIGADTDFLPDASLETDKDALSAMERRGEELTRVERLIRRRLQDNLNDARCHFELGRLHLVRNETSKAIRRFHRALTLSPAFGPAAVALGEAGLKEDASDGHRFAARLKILDRLLNTVRSGCLAPVPVIRRICDEFPDNLVEMERLVRAGDELLRLAVSAGDPYALETLGANRLRKIYVPPEDHEAALVAYGIASRTFAAQGNYEGKQRTTRWQRNLAHRIDRERLSAAWAEIVAFQQAPRVKDSDRIGHLVDEIVSLTEPVRVRAIS